MGLEPSRASAANAAQDFPLHPGATALTTAETKRAKFFKRKKLTYHTTLRLALPTLLLPAYSLGFFPACFGEVVQVAQGMHHRMSASARAWPAVQLVHLDTVFSVSKEPRLPAPRSRPPCRCFSFYLLISLFLSFFLSLNSPPPHSPD